MDSAENFPKISTGDPATLGTYRMIALSLSGMREDADAVKHFDDEILKAEHGENEVVLMSESRMIVFILSLLEKERAKIKKKEGIV